MRTGRFRKNLISLEALKREAEQTFPLVAELKGKLEAGHIAAWDFVASYILIFQRLRLSKLWPGSRLPRWLCNKSLSLDLQLFNERSIRGIPLEANRALVRWSQGEIPLTLLFHTPNAHEILDMQCLGRRCITAVVKKNELASFVMGERDPLGFVIHDLIHADKFYNDENRLDGQIKFYLDIREEFHRGVYNSLLADSKFEADFHYIISDMNSHPSHMKQTLAAAIRNAHQRENQIPIHG